MLKPYFLAVFVLAICTVNFGGLFVLCSTVNDASETCSRYSSCQQCSSDSLCSYFNQQCGEVLGEPLFSLPYSQENDYKYCSNAMSAGNINWQTQDSSIQLELSFNTNHLAIQNRVCEWRFVPNNSSQILIEIQRNSDGNEDVGVFILTKDYNRTYTTKDLISCSSMNTNLKLSDIQYLAIRTKILNNYSNFKILVSQSKQEADSPTLSNQLKIVISFSAGFAAIIILVLFFCNNILSLEAI